MSEPLRVGITGTGGLGTYLGREFVELDDVTVAAVADPDAVNRTEAADAFGVPEPGRFQSHVAMVDEVELDAVAIASPHTLHYDQVVTAMEHGLHVLCEKPLVTNLEHAEDVVNRAERQEPVLMVGYQRHLDPAYIRARRAITEWADVPKFITTEISQNWIAHQAGTWRTDPELSGGGQLYDTGSHVIDAMLWMTGLTPTSVSAEMVFHDDQRRVDTQAVLNVRFEEGTVASLSVSGDAPLVREHTHIWSDDGGVYVTGRGWSERDVTLLDPDGSEHRPGLSGTEPISKVAAFVEAIHGERPVPATARDALAVTAVTEAAYASAHAGERVEVTL